MVVLEFDVVDDAGLSVTVVTGDDDEIRSDSNDEEAEEEVVGCGNGYMLYLC